MSRKAVLVPPLYLAGRPPPSPPLIPQAQAHGKHLDHTNFRPPDYDLRYSNDTCSRSVQPVAGGLDERDYDGAGLHPEEDQDQDQDGSGSAEGSGGSARGTTVRRKKGNKEWIGATSPRDKDGRVGSAGRPRGGRERNPASQREEGIAASPSTSSSSSSSCPSSSLPSSHRSDNRSLCSSIGSAQPVYHAKSSKSVDVTLSPHRINEGGKTDKKKCASDGVRDILPERGQSGGLRREREKEREKKGKEREREREDKETRGHLNDLAEKVFSDFLADLIRKFD
jgi:hypothetical protein